MKSEEKTVIQMTDGSKVELVKISISCIPEWHKRPSWNNLWMSGSAILLEGPEKGKMTSIVLGHTGLGQFMRDLYNKSETAKVMA